MRLIHIKSWTMHEFFDRDIPKYVILSHRWEKDELTYQDFQAQVRHGDGYEKVRMFCNAVLTSKFNTVWPTEWAWVDTCCIDKTSSAELSEAINSMYRWYKQAAWCAVYLSDVVDSEDLVKSKWFTRGWTLQELLAPRYTKFYNQAWVPLGWNTEGQSIKATISEATGISENVLYSTSNWAQYSISQRMSWASRRLTSRSEDIAYCLLGLFDISMPLLYGEGQRSFLRLQLEILANSDDETIFAWKMGSLGMTGILAGSPIDFRKSRDFRQLKAGDFGYSVLSQREPYQVTNKGLQIHVHLFLLRTTARGLRTYGIPINCTNSTHSCSGYPLVMPVVQEVGARYHRTGNLIQLTHDEWDSVLQGGGSWAFDQLLFNIPMERIYLVLSRPVTTIEEENEEGSEDESEDEELAQQDVKKWMELIDLETHEY